MFGSELLADPGLCEEDHEELFRLTVAAHGEDFPDERHFLPRDLEEIDPGLFLAGILSGLDRSKLSGHDMVRMLQARERLVSHVQAGFYADIDEVAHAYDPDTTGRDPHPVEFAAEEIQTALAKTRRAAERVLDLAVRLRSRLPLVMDALAAGEIDLGRARVLARELESLHPAILPEALDRVLSQAADYRATPRPVAAGRPRIGSRRGSRAFPGRCR